MQPEADPDLVWVEALSGRSGRAVASAIDEARHAGRLFSHLAREHAREGRMGYGEIDAPLELHALVRLMRPRHVLEVGVSSGVSSAYLLHALELNGGGTLHSVDLPRPPRASSRATGWSWTVPAGRSSGWAVPFPLRKRWDLRLGNKSEVLPLLAQELSSVDLFLYDVPHEDTAALREFRWLDPLVPDGAVAIVDHGPGGGRCPSLQTWARARGSTAVGRVGTGLYGMRAARPRSRRPSVATRPAKPAAGPVRKHRARSELSGPEAGSDEASARSPST